MAEETDKKDDANKPAEGAPEGAEGAAEAAKPKSKKKLFIIIGAVAAVLLLGGGGAAFFMMHGKDKAAEAGAEGGAAGGEHAGTPGGHVYFQLGDMLVNLSGEGKHPNFLKVKVVLELADEKDMPLMEAIKPRIIDNFQVYLRELRIDDLRGSAGMFRLHEELLLRVTEAAQPIRVRDVLFQEMLVQ